MAEEILKRLEEQLKCAICFETYTEPKLLQCFHVYCKKCLVKLAMRDQHGELSLSCPTCRQITHVPGSGVAGLQAAFHINELFDIVKEAKETTTTAKTAMKTSTSTVAEDKVSCPIDPEQKNDFICYKHEGKELELYCETCGELICSHCVFRGQTHHSHEYNVINVSFDKHRDKMISLLEPMGKELEVINKSLSQLDAEHEKISDQKVAIEAKIHNTITQLQNALETRKTELISQLHRLTESKFKMLATQRDVMETAEAQLSGCFKFMKECLKADCQREVLKMKTTLERRIEELMNNVLRQDMKKPMATADITFLTSSSDIISVSACQNYSQIFTPGSPDLSKCHVTGRGVEEAVVGGRATIFLHVINFKGEPCEESMDSLTCELVSNLEDIMVRGTVERTGQSRYKISYQPTIKGRHQLHIKVNNQPIRGSPFTVRVKLPIEKLGSSISTITGLNRPWGVAVNHSGGEVVISEENGHCVSIFSPGAGRILTFGAHGSTRGQFDNPRGITVDSKGNILVADNGNHRIQKFTSGGKFLAEVHLQLRGPQDIAFNPINNKLYVVDTNDHVLILNSDLTLSSIFGRKGNHKSMFKNPSGIACDSTGKVYVADTQNHRIQVFTAKGRFLRVIGTYGQSEGELNHPVGVAVDASGIVYVSDANNCISVFTSDGQYLRSIGKGKHSELRGELCGITTDSGGIVYVCNIRANIVQLF